MAKIVRMVRENGIGEALTRTTVGKSLLGSGAAEFDPATIQITSTGQIQPASSTPPSSSQSTGGDGGGSSQTTSGGTD